jgi:hypothetical protein
MTTFTAYFDESGTHAGADVSVMADLSAMLASGATLKTGLEAVCSFSRRTRDHQGENSLQQPAGLGGILSSPS